MPNYFTISSIVVFLITASTQAGEHWNYYQNARFGVADDYPPIFSVRLPEPDNGDGREFDTPDKTAFVKIWGGYNALDQTISEMMEFNRDKITTYTYSHAGQRGFVLSGTKGGKITYERCNLVKDTVGCFLIEYPASEAAKWAPVVERMSRSLNILPVN